MLTVFNRDARKAGQQEGRRQLVKQIDSEFHASEDGIWLLIDFDKWQAILKE